MVKPASMVVALKTLMVVMFFAIIGAFVYVIAIGDIVPCYNWTLRWDLLLETQCTVIYVIFAAWFYYKESGWIKTVIYFLVIQIVGSVVTIPYILYQFSKLSPEELSKNPIYFVLARRKEREQERTKGISVTTARAIYCTLGVLLLAVLIYTITLDIIKFYAVPVTPCLFTFMVDIYIYGVLFAVWIAYKESSWISAFMWILSIVLTQTLSMIIYIVWELFKLSPDEPTSHILFNIKDKDFQSSDPPLMSHADV